MNKRKLWNAVLIGLPVLAVLWGMNPKSVTICPAEGVPVFCSYFALLPAGTVQIATPLAGILACVTAGMAIASCFGRKKRLKGIVYLSLAAACAAELPMFLRGEELIVPDVIVPLLLLGEALVAYYLHRKGILNTRETEAPAGERLDIHR